MAAYVARLPELATRLETIYRIAIGHQEPVVDPEMAAASSEINRK